MQGKEKNTIKRTIAGHEHVQLQEEYRLHNFSPDLTVAENFALLLNSLFSREAKKTSCACPICLESSNLRLSSQGEKTSHPDWGYDSKGAKSSHSIPSHPRSRRARR